MVLPHIAKYVFWANEYSDDARVPLLARVNRFSLRKLGVHILLQQGTSRVELGAVKGFSPGCIASIGCVLEITRVLRSVDTLPRKH